MRLLALALVLAVASAGCSKPGGGEGGAAQQAIEALTGPEPASTQAAIGGLVLTPSLAPVVSARVTLLRENVSTRTDATGAFLFAGLARGSYLVAAEAEGYKPRTVLAEAEEGSLTHLDLTLEPDPKPEPYKETRELRGFISCGVALQTPVREERRDCAAADPNYRDSFEIHIGPDGKTTVLELTWSADDHPGARSLRLLVETVGYGANDVELGTVVGEGYARVEVGLEAMEKFYPEGGAMRAIVSLVDDASAPQAAVQTPFTLYATTFFVAPAPADFRVVTPGA